MSDRALYFENRRGQRLFGMFQAADVGASAAAGVVFCHPFGREKHHSYRAYAEFARRLAASGIPSLRYDAFGSGDSAGVAADATIESQLCDASDAIELFRLDSGVSRVILIGLRFGAIVAAKAAAGRADIAGVVMISPVVSGARYWSELLRISQFSRLARGKFARGKTELMSELDARGVVEIDAELYSRDFVDELTRVDLADPSDLFRGPYFLGGLKDDLFEREELLRLADAYRNQGIDVGAFLDEPQDFWTVKSMYASYRPLGLYESVASWIAEVTP